MFIKEPTFNEEQKEYIYNAILNSLEYTNYLKSLERRKKQGIGGRDFYIRDFYTWHPIEAVAPLFESRLGIVIQFSENDYKANCTWIHVRYKDD